MDRNGQRIEGASWNFDARTRGENDLTWQCHYGNEPDLPTIGNTEFR